MQCKKCNSTWETNLSISASLARCPFCGESLADEDANGVKTFDNSKDVLNHIADTYGIDCLLDGSRLINIFIDYAPQLKKEKKLLRVVFEEGAASILKGHLNSRQADKEIAFKQAVARLTDDAFIAPEAAENIVREFATALGWKLSTPTREPQRQPTTRRQSTTKKQSAPVQSQKQSRSQPTRQLKPVPSINTDIIAEIAQGKKRNLQFGKYKWRVLDVRSTKALLLAEDVIEKRFYNVRYIGVGWEKCTLRRYLNNEFYQKFSSQEQARILSSQIINKNNQWYGTTAGNNTIDKVFLLSIEEVVKYFGDSGKLNRRPRNSWRISDGFNKKRVANYGNRVWWWWWLRSPGNRSLATARVYANGTLSMGGYDVNDAEGGVRPALWLSLK
jgi:hypothetical protein